MHGPTFVLDLAMVLGVAALTSVAARLLRQPTILGYLFAGLIVGPNLPVPLFADEARVSALAEFGVILVMFAVGLEFRIRKLLSVLPTSGLTGLVQVSFMLWCGFNLGQLLGWERVDSIFLGAGLCISSTMVVSSVLTRAGAEADVRRHVLGVLVVQDVLAIALIAAMTAIAAGGGLAPGDLVETLGRLALVLLLLTAGGLLVVPRLVRFVARFQDTELLVVLTIGLCFGLALVAEGLGYSVALGAFLAGVLVAESGRGGRVARLIQPLRDVFAAIFFVSIGMTVDPLQAWAHLPVALVATATVIVAQLLSVTGTGLLSGLGLRRSLSAGLALGQIGEFAFILSAIGLRAGVVGPALQPVIVTVAVLSTFTTPHLFGFAARLVHRFDAAMPRRVRLTLGLYETWVERFLMQRRGASRSPPSRRILGAVALDAVFLIVLVTVGTAWLPELTQLVERSTGLAGLAGTAVAVGVVMLAALPGLFALFRNTLRLARLVSASVLEGAPTPGASTLMAAHTAAAMVVLGVVLAVGMPFIAALRPLIDHAYGMLLLLGVLAALALHLWRSASAMAGEYRSGAEALAEFLARQGSVDDEDEAHVSGREGGAEAGRAVGPAADGLALLPGLDAARTHSVSEGHAAVGLTLAALDLRALTGATVVAIRHRDGSVAMPSGSEQLEVGDRLALVGSHTAVEAALARLIGGPLDTARRAGDAPSAVRDERESPGVA